MQWLGETATPGSWATPGSSLPVCGSRAGRRWREGLRTISYEDIDRIDVSRMNGHRGIVLELMGDDRIAITSLDRPGSLGELSELLRSLAGSPHR